MTTLQLARETSYMSCSAQEMCSYLPVPPWSLPLRQLTLDWSMVYRLAASSKDEPDTRQTIVGRIEAVILVAACSSCQAFPYLTFCGPEVAPYWRSRHGVMRVWRLTCSGGIKTVSAPVVALQAYLYPAAVQPQGLEGTGRRGLFLIQYTSIPFRAQLYWCSCISTLNKCPRAEVASLHTMA